MIRRSAAAGPAAPARRYRVLLVAGEASGDLHGADLLAALRTRRPDVEVFGIGGGRLREAGMETVADAGEVATVGVTEVVGRLRTLLRAYRALVRTLRAEPPDLCVLIDFPEFNLRLARAAKRARVPVLYYIGPQVWAWRRGRVRKIARRVDRLAVVFPFEPPLYAGRLPGVEFVGHPLLDRVAVTRGRGETLAAHGLDPARRTVLLLPGSRPNEIRSLLPDLLDAVRRPAASGPYQFPLALAHTAPRAASRRQLRSGRPRGARPGARPSWPGCARWAGASGAGEPRGARRRSPPSCSASAAARHEAVSPSARLPPAVPLATRRPRGPGDARL